jgi:hypothetical protein
MASGSAGSLISNLMSKIGAVSVLKDMVFGKWSDGNPDLKVSANLGTAEFYGGSRGAVFGMTKYVHPVGCGQPLGGHYAGREVSARRA